jgi:tungstate transport system ATP-binding protein
VSGDASILPMRAEGLRFEAGGLRLIKDLDFTLEPGPTTVICGPNGAGKSLLLRLCHGLIPPTAGRIVWAGTAAGEPRRHQAMVFQRPVMLRRSAAGNIEHALRLRGLERGERRRRIAEALALTRLARFADRPARVLSWGEQQRLALARAWALRPHVLFLDEPTANLDPAVTRVIEELIVEIRRQGTKIVLTTHDLGQMRRLGDEILFLHRGRLVERGPARQMLGSPATEAARAYFSGELYW